MTAPVLDIEAPPRFVSVPPRDGSLLRAVEGVAARVGRRLDPAQRLAVDVLTSSQRDGRPARLAHAVVCPRQNLKTFCLELITLTAMTMPGGAKVGVWSAHEVPTAQETFKTFVELAERSPWLKARIVSTVEAIGRESITFVGGRQLRLRARRKTGGRGLAGDLVVLDEAFALEPQHMGSLLPILSTRPKGRLYYGSSAPLVSSDVLRGVMERGRAGGPSAPAYIEWSSPGSMREPGCTWDRCQHRPGTPGCALDDPALVRMGNPARVYGRISDEYLRDERTELTPEEYARERLGWADDPITVERPIGAGDWAAAAVEQGDLPDGPPVFVLDASKGLRSAAIAVAALGADGRPHAELADARSGADWVVARMMELRARHPRALFGVDTTGAAPVLVPALDRAGVQVTPLSARDMGQGCGHLQRLCAGRVDGRHRDDCLGGGCVGCLPLWSRTGDQLVDAAFGAAAGRDVGDGLWCWGRRKSTHGDISPLVALTGALWLLERDRPGAASGVW